MLHLSNVAAIPCKYEGAAANSYSGRTQEIGPHGCLKVVAIREAVEDIARLESAVASGRAQPGEVDSLKHAADHAVEDLRCHVDSEALAAAARQEGLILHEVTLLYGLRLSLRKPEDQVQLGRLRALRICSSVCCSCLRLPYDKPMLLQDGYERSPPATPGVSVAAGDAAPAAASLTPASFARVRSDVFHTPAGSRFHSMEFPRSDEEKTTAAEEVAGKEQQGHGDDDSAAALPSTGRSPLSKPPYANAAASDVSRNGGSAAAPGDGDTGRRTAGEESSPASSSAAMPVMDSRAADEVGTSQHVQPPDSRQATSGSSSSSLPSTPAFAARADSDVQPSADASIRTSDAAEQAQPDALSRHAPAGTALDASPFSNAEGDPLHPWSLARPAELASPNPADAAPATISLADASAPVGKCCAAHDNISADPVNNCAHAFQQRRCVEQLPDKQRIQLSCCR